MVTYSWRRTKMKLVTQQQKNQQYLGPAVYFRPLIHLFEAPNWRTAPPHTHTHTPPSSPANADRDSQLRQRNFWLVWTHNCALFAYQNKEEGYTTEEEEAKTEDLEWEKAVWSGVNGQTQNVELDDFNTSQQKNNERMLEAVCNVRFAHFKCQFSKLLKRIGLPARHSGQEFRGCDHFSQAGCVANKLAPTPEYRTYHNHTVIVNTFQVGCMNIVNITNWRQL